MTIHRVKVTFKDEAGEGTGVARSFYTAIGEAFLAVEKLPSLFTSKSKPQSGFSLFYISARRGRGLIENLYFFWSFLKKLL